MAVLPALAPTDSGKLRGESDRYRPLSRRRDMKRLSPAVALTAVTLALSLGISGCNKEESKKPEQAAPADPKAADPAATPPGTPAATAQPAPGTAAPGQPGDAHAMAAEPVDPGKR